MTTPVQAQALAILQAARAETPRQLVAWAGGALWLCSATALVRLNADPRSFRCVESGGILRMGQGRPVYRRWDMDADGFWIADVHTTGPRALDFRVDEVMSVSWREVARLVDPARLGGLLCTELNTAVAARDPAPELAGKAWELLRPAVEPSLFDAHQFGERHESDRQEN